MHIKEAIIRMDFMEEAINEWSMLSVKQKMYITYLLRSNRKYSNPNNSHLLYAIGATDEKPNGYVKRTGGGLCDIDIDFCRDRRNEVMAYVINKYGADKVAQIGTYATFKPRGSLRSFARVLEHPQSVGDELAAMVPPNVAGKTLTFDEVIEAEPKILKTQYQDVVDLARAAEGLVSQAGIHAAGVVISDKPLTDYVPLFCGKHDEVATQFDMHGVEEVGLVKYDFLGLKNLTVIQDTINMIKTLHGVEVDISTIDPDDQEVFKKVFQRGNLAGVFQFETSSGFRDLCIKVRPESIDDLSDITSLFRPGPLGTGLVDKYVDGRNGKPIEYLVPELEPILKVTHGVMVYQESIMKICTDVAGYTLAEADNMRKIIGKKLPDKMKLERDKFVGGCVKNGIPETAATQLFDDIEGFAKYSFNKTVDKDTIVDTIDGAKRIEDCIPGDIVFSMSESGHVEQSEVIALHDHGIVPMWEVQFDDGTIEKCTLDHKWLTSSGQISLAAIIQKGKSVWGSVRKVSGSLGSYEQLPRVYRSSRRKNNKGWPSYFMGMYRMWSSLREQEKTNSTSPFMRDLQNESYKRSTFEKKNNNVVWRRNMGQSRKERSPGHMSRMSKHIKSHQTENMCLHSTYCGYEKDIFRDSEKNSKTTRDNPGPFCCISKMETRKSGEVERIYRAGTKSIKEIKSRNIPRADLRYDGIQKKLPNQMQGKQKTSRFSEYRQPNNNRDRRPLAFFSYSWARRTRENTSKRQNVRQGNNRTKDVETNTTINRSLQSKDRRSQIPNTKLSGYNSRQNMEWHSLERKVVRATFIGFCQGYDLEVDHPEHNYLLSSGLCCSNSHSVAYSIISYQTAWLKTYYPIEFYCALFNCSLDSQDDLVKYFHASKDDGIEICPPNVNISEPKFTIKNGAIVFGLAGVKGLGEKACEAIVAQRPAEGFQSIDHMIQCGVNRGAIKALAACGALSEISDVPRMSLIYNIEALMKYFEKLSNWEERERSIAQRMEEIRLAVEAGQKPPRRLPKNKDKPEMPELMDVPPAEHKDKTTLERETLGFYLTGHPMDNYPGLSRLARYSIQELKEGKAYDGEKITIPAVIFSLSERRTRNDQNMAVIIIEDGGARMEATIFPKQWKKLKSVVTEDTVNIIDGIVRVVEVDNDAEPMVRIIVNNVRPVSKDAEGGRIEPIKIGLKDGTGIEFIPAKDQNYSAYQQALALVANTQRMGY